MTSIAAMKYEGDDAGGHFVVCQQSNTAINYTIRLKVPVGLREERRVRKLLELSRGELALIITDAGVVGLGKVENAVPIAAQSSTLTFWATTFGNCDTPIRYSAISVTGYRESLARD